VIQHLVSLGASLHAINRDGKDALELAAEHGHTNCAIKLMDLGIEVKQRQAYIGSAAELADLRGHVHTAAAIRAHQETLVQRSTLLFATKGH